MWKYCKFLTEILQLPEMDVFIRGNQVDARAYLPEYTQQEFLVNFSVEGEIGAKFFDLMKKHFSILTNKTLSVIFVFDFP